MHILCILYSKYNNMAQKCSLFREQLRLDDYKLMDMDNCHVCLKEGVKVCVGKHKSEKNYDIIHYNNNSMIIELILILYLIISYKFC